MAVGRPIGDPRTLQAPAARTRPPALPRGTGEGGGVRGRGTADEAASNRRSGGRRPQLLLFFTGLVYASPPLPPPASADLLDSRGAPASSTPPVSRPLRPLCCCSGRRFHASASASRQGALCRAAWRWPKPRHGESARMRQTRDCVVRMGRARPVTPTVARDAAVMTEKAGVGSFVEAGTL